MNSHPKPQAKVFVGAASETISDEAPPDVEIDASASAAEVRALERPRTELRVSGDPEVRREDFSRRENLPHRLERGAVHRDVRVHRRVEGRLAPPEGER